MSSDNLNGDHQFPETLTVFGKLKASSVSIYVGDEEEGGLSYAVYLKGVTFSEVIKAAKLQKDGRRYIKEGMIEAIQQSDSVQLACIRGDLDANI